MWIDGAAVETTTVDTEGSWSIQTPSTDVMSNASISVRQQAPDQLPSRQIVVGHYKMAVPSIWSFTQNSTTAHLWVYGHGSQTVEIVLGDGQRISQKLIGGFAIVAIPRAGDAETVVDIHYLDPNRQLVGISQWYRLIH